MVIIADKMGRTDSAYHTLVKNIPSRIPIVMVSWVDGFIFNEELLNIKEWVCVCYCEYGWDFKITNSHIWGKTVDNSMRYSGAEWDKFNSWVIENPPIIMFKRELLKKDVSENVVPIEYPNVVGSFEVQNKTSFDDRPISVNQYWGRSNECRLRIHGEIWLHAFKKGFQPCDNVYYVNQYLQNEIGEKWVTMWIPHWARIDINNLLAINGLSKLSLSWPGAGFKCFRHSESPVNSTMVMHKNDFAWAYDWDESNCVLVDFGKEIEGIENALVNKNLHEIYLKGVETAAKYKVDNYINDYILPMINKFL